MSQLERDPTEAAPARLQGAAKNIGEPVFSEPWQARAFALAMQLSQRGHFTPSEWTQALARELRNAAAHGEPDDGSHYYTHWIAALEALILEKGLTSSRVLTERKAAWERAYRQTPHGKPVELV